MACKPNCTSSLKALGITKMLSSTENEILLGGGRVRVGAWDEIDI